MGKACCLPTAKCSETNRAGLGLMACFEEILHGHNNELGCTMYGVV